MVVNITSLHIYACILSCHTSVTIHPCERLRTFEASITSNDDANDDTKQAKSTAKDFNYKNLDKKRGILCI